jgi:hypothetical protein
MLRRYLITNGVTTAGLYLAVWGLVPSLSSVAQAAQASVQSFVMGHTLLGPMIDHLIVVSANVASCLIGIF